MAKEKNQKSKTLSAYRKWTAAKWSLYAGTYVLPVVPAAIMVGVNWDEWFAQTGNNGWSLGLGFGSLLLALLITIIGIAKKDKLLSEKVSPLYYFAGVLVLWAVALMFLANVLQNFGQMLLYTSFGLIAGATSDQVNKVYVVKESAFYKELVDTNGLNARWEHKKAKRQDKKELAAQEAERERAERQATE